MLPILAALVSQGLSLVANAALVKGKEFIEEKTGVKLTPDMPPEDILKLRQYQLINEVELQKLQLEDNKLHAELEKVAISAVTDRWKADMSSDSWMAKNIRPFVLVYLLVVVTGFAAASIWKYAIDPTWVDLFKELLKIAFGAYFLGRTVEKVISTREKKNVSS